MKKKGHLLKVESEWEVMGFSLEESKGSLRHRQKVIVWFIQVRILPYSYKGKTEAKKIMV